MKKSSLCEVLSLGQSIWLDFIRRGLLTSGELQKLIDEDCLRGVTSNPAIFEKAIDGSEDYHAVIRSLALEGQSKEEIYAGVTVDDVCLAADLFRPVYDRSGGRDGFVSLEVSPYLAHDTEGTIREARHYWGVLHRPNVMIKVPGTAEGIPAIKQLTSEGINVNVTLLFGLGRYREAANAFIAGLEERVKAGKPIEHIASVASFFLSRIDVLLDPQLEQIVQTGGGQTEVARSVIGEAAIASAKLAYQIYKEIFLGEPFRALAERGAQPQRVLWASTSTKNPAYADTKYVEPLIGPDTVNTLPLETIAAYRDHGQPAVRLEEELEKARLALDRLGELGISLDAATRQLEDEGVDKFIKPFDQLLGVIEKKRQEALAERVARQTFELGELAAGVASRWEQMEQLTVPARIWRKDAKLWKRGAAAQRSIGGSLGWLHVVEQMVAAVPRLEQFASEVYAEGFRYVVHMGMGGSSLAPLVFQQCFPTGEKGLRLLVLDTTDPASIRTIEESVSLPETLFIVASKSGSTAEIKAFDEFFFAKMKALLSHQVGQHFVAITDPDTPMSKSAEERKFRHIFHNLADIGGRYSALSYFGLVPAVLKGVNVGEILERALRVMRACGPTVPAKQNPGVVLGGVMGELAGQGRDKLTFVLPEALATFGMWLEQLVAESTGKESRGILPVAGELLGEPVLYGHDRLFVNITVKGEEDLTTQRKVEALVEAGHPVVHLALEDRYDLGQEFFRWEMATAAAGAVLSINPFDQPNVQESKENTNRLLDNVEKQGKLPDEKPSLVEGPLNFYGGEKSPDAETLLRRFCARARGGDYVAIQAYLTEEPVVVEALEAIRRLLLDTLKVATTVGFGPRFLHSTGQFHKGGPNTGLFLQLTADDPADLAIATRPYTFGILKEAQALGDMQALRKHKRRVLRVDLGADALKGLALLRRTLEAAVAAGVGGK